MEKMTKRKRQAIKTKNKILENALPLIKERGFANVSVDDICFAAGIAKGTFYHYFDHKERIFGDTGIEMDDMEVDNLLNDETMSTFTKISIVVDSYMQLAQNQGIDITRAIMRSFLEGSGIYNEGTLGREVLRLIVEEGIQRQEFNPNHNAEEIIDLVLAFSAGQIVFWCSYGGDYDLIKKSRIQTEKWLKVTFF